jgi:hypothetical protein
MYLKTVSLALLLVALFMFTGLSSLISAHTPETPAKSCCDACSKEKTRNTNTCSMPDCPLFLCLTVNTSSPISILAPEPMRSSLSSVEVRLRLSAVKAVFHPPALS